MNSPKERRKKVIVRKGARKAALPEIQVQGAENAKGGGGWPLTATKT